jgi:hypothetical protein
MFKNSGRESRPFQTCQLIKLVFSQFILNSNSDLLFKLKQISGLEGTALAPAFKQFHISKKIAPF